MDEVWPNFFIIGAAKAGTTSLHRYLSEHPQVYMSPTKEPEFFSGVLDRVQAGDVDEDDAVRSYLELFQEGKTQPVRGESSPSYMWRPEVAERIKERVAQPRLLACLRDPIERAYSDYLMGIRRGTLDGSFLEELERELAIDDWRAADPFIQRGRYHEHIERYASVFGLDRIHVILLDDLKRDPLGTLQGIARFLDIDPEAMRQVDFETVHNPYGVPRNAAAKTLLTSDVITSIARLLVPESVRIYVGEHLLLKKPEKPPMPPKARELLEGIYEPELAALEDLLGRDLGALRASWTSPA